MSVVVAMGVLLVAQVTSALLHFPSQQDQALKVGYGKHELGLLRMRLQAMREVTVRCFCLFILQIIYVYVFFFSVERLPLHGEQQQEARRNAGKWSRRAQLFLQPHTVRTQRSLTIPTIAAIHC